MSARAKRRTGARPRERAATTPEAHITPSIAGRKHTALIATLGKCTSPYPLPTRAHAVASRVFRRIAGARFALMQHYTEHMVRPRPE